MCDVSTPIQHCHKLGLKKKTMEGPAQDGHCSPPSRIDVTDDVALLSHTRQD